MLELLPTLLAEAPTQAPKNATPETTPQVLVQQAADAPMIVSVVPPEVAPLNFSSTVTSTGVAGPADSQRLCETIAPLSADQSPQQQALQTVQLCTDSGSGERTSAPETILIKTSAAEPPIVVEASAMASIDPATLDNPAVIATNTSPPSFADPDAAVAERRRLLEERLADIVQRDRGKGAGAPSTQDQLIATAISLANQGRYSQARRTLLDANLLPDVRANLLSRINSLEAENLRAGVITGSQPFQTPTQPTAAPAIPRPAAPAPRLSRLQPPLPNVPVTATPKRVPPLNPEFNQDYYSRNLPPLEPPGDSTPRFIFPLATPAPITSSYGWRVHPILGTRRFHRGTDIGAPHGTPIVAAASGRVTKAQSLGGYGLAVVIEHNDGNQDTLYAHMSHIAVRSGQWVEQGSIIGQVGSTGLSTGPHLHFELRQRTNKGWQQMDPGPMLKIALAELVRSRKGGAL